jgi:hypothetical protein
MHENFCNEHGACSEKINSLEKAFEDFKKEKDKQDLRIDTLEKDVNTIDKTLGERINTLEITVKLGNEQTNNKIDKLDRKVDKLIEKEDNQTNTKNNRTFEISKSIFLIVTGIIISYIFKKIGLY